jgi:UDP-2-acetamido-3-amino-2,3-dideoxy-glucuronate N-acetyltransferase
MMDESVFVHPLALLETEHVGSRSRVWAFAHLMRGASVGEDCNIGEQCFIEGGVSIGDRVTIKNGVAIWTGVTIESDVFVGPNAVFTNDLYPRSRVYHDHVPQTTVLRGASIGANATIIAGNTLGNFCMVGAGSVVTKSVKPYQLVVGNPARPVGWVSEGGEKLQFENGRCSSGGKTYLLENEEVRVVDQE